MRAQGLARDTWLGYCKDAEGIVRGLQKSVLRYFNTAVK